MFRKSCAKCQFCKHLICFEGTSVFFCGFTSDYLTDPFSDSLLSDCKDYAKSKGDC